MTHRPAIWSYDALTILKFHSDEKKVKVTFTPKRKIKEKHIFRKVTQEKNSKNKRNIFSEATIDERRPIEEEIGNGRRGDDEVENRKVKRYKNEKFIYFKIFLKEIFFIFLRI